MRFINFKLYEENYLFASNNFAIVLDKEEEKNFLVSKTSKFSEKIDQQKKTEKNTEINNFNFFKFLVEKKTKFDFVSEKVSVHVSEPSQTDKKKKNFFHLIFTGDHVYMLNLFKKRDTILIYNPVCDFHHPNDLYFNHDSLLFVVPLPSTKKYHNYYQDRILLSSFKTLNQHLSLLAKIIKIVIFFIFLFFIIYLFLFIFNYFIFIFIYFYFLLFFIILFLFLL